MKRLLFPTFFLLLLALTACGGQDAQQARPPTVGFSSVGDHNTVSSPAIYIPQNDVLVEVTVTRGSADVAYVELMIDGTLAGKDEVSEFEFEVDLPGTSTYQLSAVATDVNGLKSEAAVQKVTVDATAPEVEITSPQDGASVSGAVDIVVSAFDAESGIFSAEIVAGGETLPFNVVDGKIVASWQTGSLPAGAYDVVARVWNGAKLQSEASITLTVAGDGSEPVPPTAQILEDEIQPGPTSTAGCINPEGCYSGTISVPVQVNDSDGVLVTLIVGSKLGSGPVETQDKFPYIFSLDTTEYSNNEELTLTVETARVEGGLTFTSDPVTITVYNAGAIEKPELNITAPGEDEVVSGLLPVSLSVSKRSSDFKFTSALTVDLIGPGNNITATKVIPQSELVSNKTAAYTTEPFDLIKPENDTYTLRAQVDIIVDPDGVARTETLQSFVHISTSGQGEDPPASLIRMPVRPNGYDLNDPDSFPVLNRSSGLFIELSDDTGLAYVQVRLVCDVAIQKPGQNCDGEPLNGYFLNKALGGTPGPVYEPILELDIDSSVYVPDDGNYMLEITTEDTAGNTNVEEIAVTVDRDQDNILASDGAAFDSGVVAVPNPTPEELNPSSATWFTRSPAGETTSANPIRVVSLFYFDGELTGFDVDAATDTAVDGLVFGEEGDYQIYHLVEDLTTGVVRTYGGGVVTVIRNPAADTP